MITEETITTCPRHPRVETNLRCASCGTLICPRCLVHTPVGAKCRPCTSLKGASLCSLSPVQMLVSVAVALLCGAVAGLAVTFHFGFLTLFAAFAYGGFAGNMVHRVSGRKCGLALEIIAGVGILCGALGGRLLLAALQLASLNHVRPPLGSVDVLVRLVEPSPIPLIALVIVVVAAVGRIRYV